MRGNEFFNMDRLVALAREVASHPYVVRVRVLVSTVVGRLAIQLQKRPKRVAIAFSLGLHALFVMLLLIHPPHGLAGGGADGIGTAGGDGVGVSLVGVADFDREAMTAKPQPEEPEVITPLEIADADQTLSLTKMVPMPQLVSDVTPDANTLKDQSLAQAASGAPGSGNSGQNGAAGDDLWGKIAPCWKRVADANTLPVTLEMSFDASGRLSVPPTIDRDPNAPIDTQSLLSEAKALAALTQCGAYAMAAGQENVKVNFPKP